MNTSWILLVGVFVLACAGPRRLETPAGRERVDLCGECPSPHACFLNPFVEVRTLPGHGAVPRDYFMCSDKMPEELRGDAPPPRAQCPIERQRVWDRPSGRFTCCLVDGPVSVVCYADESS